MDVQESIKMKIFSKLQWTPNMECFAAQLMERYAELIIRSKTRIKDVIIVLLMKQKKFHYRGTVWMLAQKRTNLVIGMAWNYFLEDHFWVFDSKTNMQEKDNFAFNCHFVRFLIFC